LGCSVVDGEVAACGFRGGLQLGDSRMASGRQRRGLRSTWGFGGARCTGDCRWQHNIRVLRAEAGDGVGVETAALRDGREKEK
jgi:hypothetical protein